MDNENKNKKPQTFILRVIINLFYVLLPFLYIPFIIGISICIKEKSFTLENFYSALFDTNYFPYTVLVTVVVTILNVIVFTMVRERKREEELIRDINANWNSHLQQDKEQFNNLFKNKEIVVKIDIQQFDNSHVKVIQHIFSQINSMESVQDIFVVDNSHPVQWWSESMLAYLAVQSRWLRNNHNRNIHRFFILEKSDFSTNEAKKIIGLHVLMGFQTYIIVKHSYVELLNDFNKSNPNESVPNKEFFVWDETSKMKNYDTRGNPEYSCDVPSIDKIYLRGKKILCYQSLWDLDTPYHKRKDGNTFYTIDGEQINISKWNVKFEFLLPENEKNRNNFLKFSHFLKLNSETRYVSSEVKNTDKSIHIPDRTRDDSQIDIDVINGIIESFINK